MLKYSSTKRANSPRNFFTDRRRSVILIVVSILVALVLLPLVAKLAIYVVMRPLTAVAVWVRESPGVLPTYLRQRSALQAEKEAMQAEIDAQKGLGLTVETLAEENIALRAAMGESVEPRLLARVVGRPPFLAYDRLQIDKGSEDSVGVGAPVFVGRGVVIGSVVEVGPNYSFVELVTAPGFQSTVYLPSSALVATMEGQGGGVGRVRYPQGIIVEPGDLVVGLAYESGVFGQVNAVVGESTQPEQYAFVPLPVPIQSLRYVTVGRPALSAREATEVASSTRALLDSIYLQPGVAVELSATTTEGVATSSATGTEPLP